MTRWQLGIACLPLLAACELATPPDRTEVYDVSPRLANGFPILFRWPAASLPVRIWADPGLDMPHHVTEAVSIWQAGALYGEFRAVLVEDSADADVMLRIGATEVQSRGERRACSSATRLEVDLDTAIVLPFQSTISPRAGWAAEDVQACFAIAVTHEVGHVLGLFLHSSDPGDVMFAIPTAGHLSVRDVATFQTLYHTAPTVHLPPGR